LEKLSKEDIQKKLKAYEKVIAQLIEVAGEIEKGVEENIDLEDVEKRQETCAAEVKRLEKRQKTLEGTPGKKSGKKKKKGGAAAKKASPQKEEKPNPYKKLGESLKEDFDAAMGKSKKKKNNLKWEDIGTKKGVQLSRYKDPASPILMMKGETEINCAFEDLIDFLCNFATYEENTKAADPMLIKADYLEKWGPDAPSLDPTVERCCVLFNSYKMPIGVTNRDFVFYGRDISVDDGAGYYSIAASVEHKEGKEKKGFIRGAIESSGYYIENRGKGKTALTYLVQVDAKGWLPAWVINLTAKDQAMNVLRIKEQMEASDD